MNDKVGSRDLDDEIIDAGLEVIEVSDCDEELADIKAEKKVGVKTEKSGPGFVACCPAADHVQPANLAHSCAHNNGQDLLANISQVLNPTL